MSSPSHRAAKRSKKTSPSRAFPVPCGKLLGNTGVDPETGKRVALFHPRRDVWTEHFRWDGVEIKGITPKGRATVQILRLNRPSILVIRDEETFHGRFPP
jgi:hypothetical protein